MQVMLTTISVMLGGGVLAFLQFLINRHDKKKARSSNVLVRLDRIDNSLDAVKSTLDKQMEFNRASGADRVSWLGRKYIKRGCIGFNEWALYKAEFDAYERIGGNGTAKVIFEEVKSLDRIDDQDIKGE